MSNEKGGRPPAPNRSPDGPAPETTIVQRVLGKTVLALESTMTRLRRLQHHEESRAPGGSSGTRPSAAQVPPARPAATAPRTPSPQAPARAPAAPAPREAAPSNSAAPGKAPASSGKVAHDSRGNAIWNWAANALESTSRMLKRLEAPELSLDDKPKQSQPLELEQRDTGGGYGPYSKGSRGGGAGYDPYGKGAKQRKP